MYYFVIRCQLLLKLVKAIQETVHIFQYVPVAKQENWVDLDATLFFI